MEKVLVIIDMQNDFISGALANGEAVKIVPKIALLAGKWDGRIIFTRDTHKAEYLKTQEGKYLPIEHCIEGTHGWQINEDIHLAALGNEHAKVSYVDKPAFGAGSLLYDEIMRCGAPSEVTFVGTCTDICVVSNALILKSFLTETPMRVIENCCAGLTPEKHAAAIDVMSSCQIDVVTYQ